MADRYEGLLTGAAQFSADVHVPDVLHVQFVRSPLASARIVHIDTSEARDLDDVVAVFSGDDLPMLPVWEIAFIPEEFAQPPLARGRVRYVGERVVAVVATTAAAAEDAVGCVIVEYEPLPALIDMRHHDRAGVPTLFDTHPDNVCLDWPGDDSGGCLDGAAVATTVNHVIPRLSAAPMEGHSVVAVPDAAGRLTLWISTQVPTATQRQIARTLGMPLDDVRIVVPAVGGGFGGKAAGGVCDHMVVAAAARTLGRPVRFVEDRSANLLSMQGRGVRNTVTLHATATGEVIGIEADVLADAGAYPTIGAVEPGKTCLMICGPYRLQRASVRARSVVTNLAPVGAYRGPGRSEATLMLERTLDVLAADLGIDPVEIRRRNLLPMTAFPHPSPTGIEYDSGNYGGVLETLVAESGYDDLRAVQRARHETGGRLLGIGVAFALDSTAWFSRVEGASISIDATGTVTVSTGSASAGQQHAALYRNIVRRVLPVPEQQITVIEGDTSVWSASDGSMGSRTTQMAGTAILRSAEIAYDKLRQLAAQNLEASAEDMVFHGARLGVRGVPSSALTLQQLVAGTDGSRLEASCVYEQPGASYPSAAHLSVVDVDVETGRVVPLRHVAVTDCGVVLDRCSARSQVIGATVQGIAQALYEESVFDADGNPLTSTFAEYGIPSAVDVPWIETHFVETPSPRNPLGAKGVGEIGMIAAPVAVQNAVVDAVRHLGVRHLDMPCTPENVWAAIHHHGNDLGP